MTAKERIRKLEDLLSRVQTRAQEPRANGVAYAAPEPAAYVESPVVSVAVEEEEPDSLPPDTAHGDRMYAGADDSEVEVSSETVEVDIDIDEPISQPISREMEAVAGPNMESGAQPVALPTMPPDELEEVEEELPHATQPSFLPPAEEPAQLAPPANEIEEEAPSSSRRPIAGEEPAESYSEESAPRHTPPPESGKQVAAPSVHPAARGSEPSFDRAVSAPPELNPSAPPPSLEGHTLVGGWREPGLGPQITAPAGVTTGVRVPPSPATAAKTGTSTSPAIPAATSGTRLSPEVTRPELAATANVARIEGAPPAARPTTMGELLDLTLSL